MNYFRWYSVPDSICRGKEKGVTAHHRNPWFSLWWRRGDLNSRPPPCEGDALPAELLPHMDATTRRSEMCMPFTCRGQVFFVNRPSVVRERRACCPWHVRAGQLLSRLRQAEGMLAPVSTRMGRKRHVRRSRQLFLKRSFLGIQVNALQLSRKAWAKPDRSEAGLRTSAQSVRTRGISKATPSGWQTSRHAGQSLRHPRGPLLPPSLKKIGRAAPVGLGYREKKRYRSPLVSL